MRRPARRAAARRGGGTAATSGDWPTPRPEAGGLLAGMQQDIGVALAGRAGCRLARALGAPASRQVPLRQIMAVPDPAADTPRVLGVDDSAVRRGQHYGTVLIDCQTGAPLGLLAGREAGPLADRLAAHPGVQVICRDRSGAQRDQGRPAAPSRLVPDESVR